MFAQENLWFRNKLMYKISVENLISLKIKCQSDIEHKQNIESLTNF